MLFENEINNDSIKCAKLSVELEIGEPSRFAELFGFDVSATIFERYFPDRDFMESEFGISYPFYSANEYRLSNRRLTMMQLKNHYESYYRPSNIVLFISGNFDPDHMISLVSKVYGKYEDSSGKTLPIINPVPASKPYWRVKLFPFSHPYIYVGTKTLDLSAKEEVTLHAYLDYMVNTIMKNLRNKHGETYTAESYSYEKFGAGYGIVGFQTQHKEFNKNFSYVKSLIEEKAKNGQLTDKEIEEAISLTKGLRYELTDVDADSMLKLAEDFYDFREDNNANDTRYAILTSLSPQEFRNNLKSIFEDSCSYTMLYIPYKYSKLELLIIILITMILSILFYKKLFKRRIDVSKVKWERKVSYSPGMLIEIILVLGFSLIPANLISSPIMRYVNESQWYNNPDLWPAYLVISFNLFLYVSICVSIFMVLPKKLILEGNSLVIESVLFYLRRYDKSKIKSIESMSLFKLMASPKIWLNIRLMWFYSLFFFWRKGLLLKIDKGFIYYIGVKDADKVVSDLESVIET
jgi:hypothetical protein